MKKREKQSLHSDEQRLGSGTRSDNKKVCNCRKYLKIVSPTFAARKPNSGDARILQWKNGRCGLHGGLTPKKHPNHQAKFNALKTGRYAKHFTQQVDLLNAELTHIDELIHSIKLD